MILRSFIDTHLYRIHGFMHPTDAMMFAGILEAQADKGWNGALAEIGVFYGRSLALMALNARATGDPIVGFDLFDIPGQKDYVERLFNRFPLGGPPKLTAASSLNLSTEDILSTGGPIRLFHIDGGHELHHIVNDAQLARDSICDYGVIAFDDFMNPSYPDVTVGIIRFLEENQEALKPFAISKAKLYVAPADHYDDYIEIVRNMELWAGAFRQEFAFNGNQLVHVEQFMLDRTIYQKMAERGLGRIGSGMNRGNRQRFKR